MQDFYNLTKFCPFSVQGGTEVGKEVQSNACWQDKQTLQLCYGWNPLETTKEKEDVGIYITDDLKPSRQCSEAVKKVNRALGQLTWGLSYRDKSSYIYTTHYWLNSNT